MSNQEATLRVLFQKKLVTGEACWFFYFDEASKKMISLVGVDRLTDNWNRLVQANANRYYVAPDGDIWCGSCWDNSYLVQLHEVRAEVRALCDIAIPPPPRPFRHV